VGIAEECPTGTLEADAAVTPMAVTEAEGETEDTAMETLEVLETEAPVVAPPEVARFAEEEEGCLEDSAVPVATRRPRPHQPKQQNGTTRNERSLYVGSKPTSGMISLRTVTGEATYICR